MPSPSAHQQLDNRALLHDACARNFILEIHYQNRAGEFFAARTRLLDMTEEVLLLDTPQCVGKKILIREGQAVEAYVTIDHTMYVFQSQVVRTRCTIELNRYKTIDGLAIKLPSGLRESQRRHDLRVGITDDENRIPVRVHACDNDCSAAAPLEVMIFKGRVGNLSGGGCGLILDTVLSSKFTIGHPMFVGLMLPGDDEETIFQVEVRNISLMPARDKATRLGLQFLNWPSRAYLRRSLRTIEKLIADTQRKAAQKRSSNRK